MTRACTSDRRRPHQRTARFRPAPRAAAGDQAQRGRRGCCRCSPRCSTSTRSGRPRGTRRSGPCAPRSSPEPHARRLRRVRRRARRLGRRRGRAAGRPATCSATTARPAWARQASALAATLFWLVLAFLAGVASIYIQTALQATWGGPPLWPVAVGVVGVVAFCACRVHRAAPCSPAGSPPRSSRSAPSSSPVIGVHAANSVNNFVDVRSAKGTAALSVDGRRPPLGR